MSSLVIPPVLTLVPCYISGSRLEEDVLTPLRPPPPPPPPGGGEGRAQGELRPGLQLSAPPSN